MDIERHSALTFHSTELFYAKPWELKDIENITKDRITVFLHIPKCGGTSLDMILNACSAYGKKHYQRVPIRDFAPPVLMQEGWTGAWPQIAEVVKTLPDTVRAVSGHFPFGFHQAVSQPCRYITLIRDSVTRELSNYNFHYQRGFIDGGESLESWLEQGKILDNPQVRMLVGPEAMQGKCTEEMLQQAYDHLTHHFDLVGVVEQSNEFIQALLGLYGWPMVAYPRAQITGVKLIEKASAALREQLTLFHALDVKLHLWAAEKWQEWKSKHVAGDRTLVSEEDILVIPQDFQQHGKVQVIPVADVIQRMQ